MYPTEIGIEVTDPKPEHYLDWGIDPFGFMHVEHIVVVNTEN